MLSSVVYASFTCLDILDILYSLFCAEILNDPFLFVYFFLSFFFFSPQAVLGSRIWWGKANGKVKVRGSNYSGPLDLLTFPFSFPSPNPWSKHSLKKFILESLCDCNISEKILIIILFWWTGCTSPLALDGQDMKLISIKVNSKELKVCNMYRILAKYFIVSTAHPAH